jgi:hypothetical protein
MDSATPTFDNGTETFDEGVPGISAYRPSKVLIAIPTRSSDNLYWGRYPQGNKPVGMSGNAAVTVTGSGQVH